LVLRARFNLGDTFSVYRADEMRTAILAKSL
jgi:hypothetical protein